MSIRSVTLQRLLREHFSATSPMVVRAEEGDALMQRIRGRVGGMKYVTVNPTSSYGYSSRDSDKFLGHIEIKDQGDRRGWRDSTDIKFKLNGSGQLVIEARYEEALVSNLDQIVAFVTACQEAVEHDHAVKSRQKKVRDLKAQAIIAQVKKLAKEEQFDFYTESDTQKLSLYIQLTDDYQVELQIPYSKFQEILPELRTAILALRQLAQKGIKFKLKLEEKSNWRGWVLHEEL